MRFTTDVDVRTARERRRPRRAAALSAVVLLTMSACTSAPSTTDPYRGGWVGTIDDRTAGVGTLRLELRAESRVEGSWTATFGVSQIAGGLAADSSSAAERTFAVGCPQGSMVWATTVGGDLLSGTYVAAGCGFLSSGRIEARRR